MTVDFNKAKSESPDPLNVIDDPRPALPDSIIDQLTTLVASSNLNAEPSLIQIRAGSLFARLKALNRTTNASARVRKQSTNETRDEVDHTHLLLQNLRYEQRHLEREIEKCRQFGSIYQDVSLNTREEFEQLAPEAARSPEVLNDPHQLMLNRLSFELAERQRLEQRRKELLAQKEEMLKQSKAKTATIDNVKMQVDLLVKTAADIQKKVDDLVGPMQMKEAGT